MPCESETCSSTGEPSSRTAKVCMPSPFTSHTLTVSKSGATSFNTGTQLERRLPSCFSAPPSHVLPTRNHSGSRPLRSSTIALFRRTGVGTRLLDSPSVRIFRKLPFSRDHDTCSCGPCTSVSTSSRWSSALCNSRSSPTSTCSPSGEVRKEASGASSGKLASSFIPGPYSRRSCPSCTSRSCPRDHTYRW